MLARDLAEQVPTVSRETTGAEAARVVAEYRLAGLVVADHGVPHMVIPGTQILGLILPGYLREDPGLAHALDESAADELCQRLNEVSIGRLLDRQVLTARTPATVHPEDTLVEVASVMVEGRHPLILVIDSVGAYVGTILTSRVLAAAAQLAGQDSPLVRRRLDRDVAQRGEPWIPDDSSGDGAPGQQPEGGGGPS